MVVVVAVDDGASVAVGSGATAPAPPTGVTVASGRLVATTVGAEGCSVALAEAHALRTIRISAALGNLSHRRPRPEERPPPLNGAWRPARRHARCTHPPNPPDGERLAAKPFLFPRLHLGDLRLLRRDDLAC